MKKLLAFVLCLCFVVGMLAGCGEKTPDADNSSKNNSSKTDTVTYTVPDFTGKVADEVKNSADYKDVCTFEIVLAHSSKVEKGKVISQLPVAGEQFDDKPVITLTVSDGPNMVEIPNIYKKTMEDARKALEDIGFTVIVYQEYHSTVEKGLVYSVTPSIGSEIADDSEVTIYISMGPDPDKLNEEKYSTLPNLVGKTRFEAERLIAESGLTLGTVKEIYSDKFEYGKVCEMSLKPGKVTVGTVINITISLGPETFFPAN